MFNRRLFVNLLLTAVIAVLFLMLKRDSISGFDVKLSAGLCISLLVVIWLKPLIEHRARLTATVPCCALFLFVHNLVERGPGALGTWLGGSLFLTGIIGLGLQLRRTAKPADEAH